MYQPVIKILTKYVFTYSKHVIFIYSPSLFNLIHDYRKIGNYFVELMKIVILNNTK